MKKKSKPANGLSAEDRRYLASRERCIVLSIKTSIAASKAIREIHYYKGGLLWRATHESFTSYCLDRWKYARSHVYRLVQSGEIISELEKKWAYQQLDVEEKMPTSEAHLRPLQRLAPDKRVDCWERIVSKTRPADLTIKIVEEETAAYAAEIGDPIRKPNTGVPPDEEMSNAISCLRQLRAAVRHLSKAGEISTLLDLVEELLV